MKSIFRTIILVAAVSVISCKKETSKPEAQKKKMEFKMNIDKASLQTEANDLPYGGINQLTYVIFQDHDEQYNIEVARYTQMAGDPDFGSHTFSLPPGKYKSQVVGSTAPFTVMDYSDRIYYEDARMAFTQPGTVLQYRTGDTFVATRDFNYDTFGNLSYTLTRIVGKIELKIGSPTPYTVKIKNEATEYFIHRGESQGAIAEPYVKTIENPDAHNEILILRTDQPLQLEISAGGVTKELAVDVRKNKRTVIQGTLNSLNAHVMLDAVINDEWSSETTEIEF